MYICACNEYIVSHEFPLLLLFFNSCMCVCLIFQKINKNQQSEYDFFFEKSNIVNNIRQTISAAARNIIGFFTFFFKLATKYPLFGFFNFMDIFSNKNRTFFEKISPFQKSGQT